MVLGADTRATRGDIVSDKNCEKIHFITESIRCCGAGTAADTQFVTGKRDSRFQGRTVRYVFCYERSAGFASSFNLNLLVLVVWYNLTNCLSASHLMSQRWLAGRWSCINSPPDASRGLSLP